MTGQDDWTSRSLHSPISDGPGRLGARSLHSPVSLDRPGRLDFVRPRLWDLVPGVFDSTVSLHPFLGPVLCLGVTSHHPQHRGDPQETTTPENRTTEKPENRSRRAGVTEWSDRATVCLSDLMSLPIECGLFRFAILFGNMALSQSSRVVLVVAPLKSDRPSDPPGP